MWDLIVSVPDRCLFFYFPYLCTCKTSPRTSTIVQFIFYFGSLRSAIIFREIRNKWLVYTHIIDRFFFIWTLF